ncbi:MAG: sulfatase-like hydrolase/transferase, partial [Planctomycetes bacterium]|nr:sulfatase-like hydrolase/transferase [Planctomycetota bacterium]
MKTRRFYVSVVLFLTLASLDRCESVAAAPPAKRPNVLLIYTDDHAQWAMGAYGNKEVQTPNMDRLAAQGMRFTRGFTKPVCSPSRAMLLSGRYSHRLGIPDYIPYGNPVHAGNGLPADTPTIASVLKSAGYATGLVGKWHLGYGEKYYPARFGFDHAEGYRYIAPGKQYKGVGRIPFLVDGKEEEHFGKKADVASDCTTILADRAIHFLQSNRQGPFFLFLSFYRPHLAWQPVPDEDFAHYKDRPVTVPDPPAGSSVTKEKVEELTRLYYANITCADRNMGRVFAALDELDLADNTIVLFIGDNGFMVGQHELLGKGNARQLHVDERGRVSRQRGTRANMFDESVLAPFVVRWPGVVKPGSTNDALVSTIDVLPTLAETAGVETPPGVDGRSLLPLLEGAPNVVWRDAYCDTYDMIYLGDDGEKPHMRMICTDDWKLVLYHDENGDPLAGGSRHELFDLKGDPRESDNLYGKPSAAAPQRNLEKKLRAWMRDTGVARQQDTPTTVTLSGTPTEIGETWGTINRQAIHNAVEQYLAKAKAESLSEETLVERSQPFVAIARKIAPHWIEEAQAIARAAGIDADLYLSLLANVPRSIGFHECTSYAVSREFTQDGAVFFHKNRDNVDCEQAAYVLTSSAEGVNKFLAVSNASAVNCSMMVNEKGLAGSADYPANLTRRDDPGALVPEPAEPRYRGVMNDFLLRHVAERASSCDEALNVIQDCVNKGYSAGGTVNGTHWLFVDRTGTIMEISSNARHVVSRIHTQKVYFSRRDESAAAKRLRQAERPIDFHFFHTVSRD